MCLAISLLATYIYSIYLILNSTLYGRQSALTQRAGRRTRTSLWKADTWKLDVPCRSPDQNCIYWPRPHETLLAKWGFWVPARPNRRLVTWHVLSTHAQSWLSKTATCTITVSSTSFFESCDWSGAIDDTATQYYRYPPISISPVRVFIMHIYYSYILSAVWRRRTIYLRLFSKYAVSREALYTLEIGVVEPL